MGRRDGILQALTIDVEKFFEECDPDEDMLCLYGCPDGTWQLVLPPEGIPHELPAPTVAINFARVGDRNNWLRNVAYHSDSWLLYVAFFHADCAELDKESRNELFRMINDLPTVSEIITENTKDNRNQLEKSTSTSSSISNKLDLSWCLEQEGEEDAIGRS